MFCLFWNRWFCFYKKSLELLTIQRALKEPFFFMSAAVRAQDTQTQVACESCEMSDVLFIGPRDKVRGRSAGALCA